MAILAIEDDPQNGWDHVSGYRTTAYVVSPYARRGAVVSTQYNTVCLLRTIEQILGLAPMNQFDAAAPPMRDCFTDAPDFTPYVCLPNTVPLDQMNPSPHAIADPQQRADAIASAKMNFEEVDRRRGRAEPHPLARCAARSPIPSGPSTRSATRRIEQGTCYDVVDTPLRTACGILRTRRACGFQHGSCQRACERADFARSRPFLVVFGKLRRSSATMW